MGSILSAIGTVRQADSALKGKVSSVIGTPVGGGGSQDPGVSLPDPSVASTPVDFSQVPLTPTQGQAQSPSQTQPTTFPISMADLSGMGTNLPPVDYNNQAYSPGYNPYVPDTNTSPTSVANSIGQDNFTPPSHEGLLGKIGDAILMMRGREPIFRDRTIQANERAAIASSMQNGQLDTGLLMKRMEAIPGANPMDAPNLMEQSARANYFNAVGQQREDMQRDKGVSILSNAFGVGGALNPQNPKAAANYTAMRPMLMRMGSTFGVPEDMLGTMLPEEYNPTMASTIGATGISGYDQLRAGIMQNTAANENAYRGAELNLRQEGLHIEQANSQTETARAVSEIQKNQEGSFTNRSAFYQKVLGPAARIPWLFGNFMAGKFGGGSSGLPKPGVAYVSPDKTMALKMNANGGWTVYDISKGTNHARPIQQLGGVINTGQTDDNGDFAQ